MAESFPTMKGGDGAFSYAKNSQFQKEGSDFVKAMIQEAIIENLEADISNTVAIVDLGCSVGPNTLFAAQNMIEALDIKTSGGAGLEMELEVFFNDQAANDFNTLLASLPPPPLRQYYAAAVPGSFHGRLFPRARITLAHSSFALHFLSKVPEEITRTKSPAWNEGRIHYTGAGASPHVVKEYSEQFGRDMGVFLSARAEEIVKGGLMFLIIPGIGDGLTHSQGPYSIIFSLLESSILDLANQGVIGKAEMDSFNLPIYFPSGREVREAIEENGCFSVERGEWTTPRPKVGSRGIAVHLRAGFEGYLTNHFGESAMEKVFANTLAKAQQHPHVFEAALHDSTQLFYVLKRT